MKSGWTVALVIAASLSAQSVLAADERPGEAGICSLLRLLSAASLVSADARLVEARIGTTGVRGALAAADLPRPCSACFCNEAVVCGYQPEAGAASPAGLLRFDIEVRGP